MADRNSTRSCLPANQETSKKAKHPGVETAATCPSTASRRPAFRGPMQQGRAPPGRASLAPGSRRGKRGAGSSAPLPSRHESSEPAGTLPTRGRLPIPEIFLGRGSRGPIRVSVGSHGERPTAATNLAGPVSRTFKRHLQRGRRSWPIAISGPGRDDPKGTRSGTVREDPRKFVVKRGQRIPFSTPMVRPRRGNGRVSRGEFRRGPGLTPMPRRARCVRRTWPSPPLQLELPLPQGEIPLGNSNPRGGRGSWLRAPWRERRDDGTVRVDPAKLTARRPASAAKLTAPLGPILKRPGQGIPRRGTGRSRDGMNRGQAAARGGIGPRRTSMSLPGRRIVFNGAGPAAWRGRGCGSARHQCAAGDDRRFRVAGCGTASWGVGDPGPPALRAPRWSGIPSLLTSSPLRCHSPDERPVGVSTTSWACGPLAPRPIGTSSLCTIDRFRPRAGPARPPRALPTLERVHIPRPPRGGRFLAARVTMKDPTRRAWRGLVMAKPGPRTSSSGFRGTPRALQSPRSRTRTRKVNRGKPRGARHDNPSPA